MIDDRLRSAVDDLRRKLDGPVPELVLRQNSASRAARARRGLTVVLTASLVFAGCVVAYGLARRSVNEQRDPIAERTAGTPATTLTGVTATSGFENGVDFTATTRFGQVVVSSSDEAELPAEFPSGFPLLGDLSPAGSGKLLDDSADHLVAVFTTRLSPKAVFNLYLESTVYDLTYCSANPFDHDCTSRKTSRSTGEADAFEGLVMLNGNGGGCAAPCPPKTPFADWWNLPASVTAMAHDGRTYVVAVLTTSSEQDASG